MRALATVLEGQHSWNDEAESADVLRSAAEEVGRLRTELAISENRAGGYEEVVAGLRAVIENAPHAVDCRAQLHGGDRYGYGGDARYCICWKSDALWPLTFPLQFLVWVTRSANLQLRKPSLMTGLSSFQEVMDG